MDFDNLKDIYLDNRTNNNIGSQGPLAAMTILKSQSTLLILHGNLDHHDAMTADINDNDSFVVINFEKRMSPNLRPYPTINLVVYFCSTNRPHFGNPSPPKNQK